MELISSKSNLKVRQIRDLQQSSKRRESGLFIAEGIHHVGEAYDAMLAGKVVIHQILYAPGRLTSTFAQNLITSFEKLNVPCYPTTNDVFKSVAEKENPQGILAVLQQPKSALKYLDETIFPWGVAIVDPQDPGNIGAILRTIDAVGASGLILLDGGVDPYHTSSVRASLGTIFWYPVIQESFDEFCKWIKLHGYWLVGTSAKAKEDYRNVDLSYRPVILLLGSEREGLTDKEKNLCDLLIRLPMRGKATSLNLAVSAGILLYAMQESNPDK
jgi:TrmH family RNA methyltransferase